MRGWELEAVAMNEHKCEMELGEHVTRAGDAVTLQLGPAQTVSSSS